MTTSIRDIWYNYKSEVLFGLVLLSLTVLSYWLATFIPESVFENYINPFEYISTIAVCFFGAFLLFRHMEQNTLRRSWAIVLLVWGCIDLLTLGARYILDIKAIGGTPDDPLFNASVTLGSMKRAEALKAYMVQQGVDASQIKCDSKGQNEPIAPNDTRANRALNRRAQITIL